MIEVKPFNTSYQLKFGEIKKALEERFDSSQDKLQSAFLKTVDSWDNKPEFIKEKGAESRKVYTTSLIYKFISGGTKVRYMHMTPDFSPKTAPGMIDSTAGAGGAAYFNSQRPRPGIKARNFDEMIKATFLPVFKSEILRALKNR